MAASAQQGGAHSRRGRRRVRSHWSGRNKARQGAGAAEASMSEQAMMCSDDESGPTLLAIAYTVIIAWSNKQAVEAGIHDDTHDV